MKQREMTTQERRVYWVWAAMVARCTNPKSKQFHDYGGRGISVCSEWRSSKQFMADMGPRPDGGTLERRDNDAGYSKQNCYWASRAVQSLNKRIYKTNKTGVRGIKLREVGYRVQFRRNGIIAFDKTVHDFFEACCVAISKRTELSQSS